jgi:hypothetical protein
MTRPVALVLLCALFVGPPAVRAQQTDCSRLPTSAQRAHTCNPRQQCLAQVERTLKGSALESGRRDCQRLPTSGTCYGPETYNPQAECQARQRR